MKTVTLTYEVIIQASEQAIFEYVSDWEKQSDWILFTTVKNTGNSENWRDVRLLATTGVGPIKVADTMVITDWQPYSKIVVEHTGRVVLGKGVFTVEEVSPNTCKFVWQEITPVPFGFAGQAGLMMVKPFMKLMFDMSLKKLKRNIESLPS